MAIIVNGRFWSTENNFEFPENSLPEIKTKQNIGIATSGGGTRAASLTAGYLHALNKIKVLKDVKYLSAVSGGGWASVPFTFLDDTIEDKVFFGDYFPPEDLKYDFLMLEEDYTLNKAAAHAEILELFDNHVFGGDELYSRIIGDIFLKPYNLHHRKKFISYNENTVQEVLSRNPTLSLMDFYTVNGSKNRPFLIVGGTFLRPKLRRYHFEMTPLYVGSYAYHKRAGSQGKIAIGGGYIESHAFDSDSPHNLVQSNNGTEAELRLGRKKHIFSLSDVVGVTGSAPAEYAERFGLGWIGFPEFKYWNPRDVKKQSNKAKEYDIADGGILENLGIMPLLLRGVDRIFCFANGSTPLKVNDEVEGGIDMGSSIRALFKPIHNYGDKDFGENVVFENKNGELDTLIKALFEKKRKGEAAVFTDTYTTVDQKHYGVKAGRKVKVTWVYNDMPQKWYKALPLPVKALIDDSRFPHYKTFAENPPRIIDLKIYQTKLLSQLASWVVESNEAEFLS